MSIHFSTSLVIAETATELLPNAGILAYKNIVTFDTLTATSEILSSPATNMSNPATAFTWEASSTATQTITIQADEQQVNYIGIARHNLNQIGLTLEIKFNGVTVIPAQAVSENQALLFVVNEATPTTIELVIAGATTAPKIAVLYAGLSTRLERNIYVGHTPITYGRNRTTVNGVSENGQFLGEINVRETLSTQVSLQNLTPAWYRSTLDPFFNQKPRNPCFFAWRPGDYPDEIGFCWVEGNPQPSNQRPNGMMEISWNFKGIV